MTKSSKPMPLMLCINALLLGVLVFLELADGQGTVQHADAAPPRGIPNAAEQRQRIADRLDTLSSTIESMQKTLKSGNTKINITNMSDLESRTASNAERDIADTTARITLNTVRAQLELYRMRNGTYPSTLAALYDEEHPEHDGISYLRSKPVPPPGYEFMYDATAGAFSEAGHPRW
ncbi:MAG: type II secretion system protein GspG [Planctomycetota bacterium]